MMFSLIVAWLVLEYSFFLFWCCYHWWRIKNVSAEALHDRSISVAVIIPARNEQENLTSLLSALAKQDYPREKFQVIVSDDHSEDETRNVAETFFRENKTLNGKCLQSPGISKKNAIDFAVRNTDAELIITTDADAVVGTEWISSIVSEKLRSDALMICCPVSISTDSSFQSRLQALEYAGLSGMAAAGIHAGKPMFCSGAGLAFTKKVFIEVNGYENSGSDSGDDTQALLKVHRAFPGRASYLKDRRAIVRARQSSSLARALQQRRRWASKIPGTLSGFTIVVSLLAWLLHLFLLIQIIRSFYDSTFLFLLMLMAVKILSEIILLRTVNRFFGEKTPFWLIIVAQPVYILYIVIVGAISPFTSFEWKGRRTR